MINKRFFRKKGTYIGLFLKRAIVVLVVTMMWQFAATTVFAQNQDGISQDSSEQDDSIQQSKMSIDDNFTDDTILVTLSQKASLNFKRYKTSDFPEVNLVSVIEITEDLTNRVENQAQNNNTNGNDNNSNNGQGNNGNGRRINIDSFKRIFQLKLAEPSKESVLEAISVLGKRDDVRAAEPNYIGEFLVAPNDTYISNQWAINNMRLPEAWELSTGANTVRVGLVDSGIDRNHLDLAGRINEGLSRDHSGGGNPWTGTNGHGTHTAGIIGAIGNNSRGVVGMNWDV